jgi:hypothetical protein
MYDRYEMRRAKANFVADHNKLGAWLRLFVFFLFCDPGFGFDAACMYVSVCVCVCVCACAYANNMQASQSSPG